MFTIDIHTSRLSPEAPWEWMTQQRYQLFIGVMISSIHIDDAITGRPAY